ncbi:hypothetical protein BX600DRAFT_201180 [Xylariales sp. PMI_506]|nr:hypothetical protein BX600DRAFT_201180 [Xylariales sp. PMI_506]
MVRGGEACINNPNGVDILVAAVGSIIHYIGSVSRSHVVKKLCVTVQVADDMGGVFRTRSAISCCLQPRTVCRTHRLGRHGRRGSARRYRSFISIPRTLSRVVSGCMVIWAQSLATARLGWGTGGGSSELLGFQPTNVGLTGIKKIVFRLVRVVSHSDYSWLVLIRERQHRFSRPATMSLDHTHFKSSRLHGHKSQRISL